MNWNKKRVFVSGGAGVIGTYLVEKLVAKGADIFVGDLKPCPVAWKSVLKYREGDLNDIGAEELLAFDPEVFFHLAATFERSVETSDFWAENYHHNICLSHYLLNCFLDSRSLKKIIFASSYLVYDPHLYLSQEPSGRPVDISEQAQLNPRNLCGMAKLYHERELQFTHEFHKELSFINARIFRSYGKNSRDIISRWVRLLLKEEVIALYSPEGVFDFIYAEDVAEGLLRLGETSYYGSVNLGSGNSRSIYDVVEILKSHFPHMKIKKDRVEILYESSQADIQLLKNLTNWKPEHTLEEGISEIIKHESN